MKMPNLKATVKSIIMLRCPHKNYTYAHLLLLSDPIKNNGGVIIEEQQYMPVNVTSTKLHLIESLKTGDHVTVSSHLNTRAFPGKDGQTRHRYVVQLSTINKS